jgi:Mg-chelatase subunit ChlD
MADRVFILDRSGSMENCREDTIGGFNAFLREQKALGGTLSLILFDHEYTPLYDKKAICDVEPMTTDTFVPRGSTALLDAIGKTIKAIEADRTPIVAILTDGLENASNKFTKAHIKDLIDQKTKEGWTFMYLGANQDAFQEAGALGIGPAGTLNYDSRRTGSAFQALSAAMSQTGANRGHFETQII